MPSQNSAPSAVQGPLALKTGLLLLAVALAALEYFIPRIPLVPWLKPGLANIVTVVWLVRYGMVEALLFSLLRTWTTGFYFGFSFMTLLLALAGAVAATVAMGVMWRLFGRSRLLGLVGLGLIGAFAHNAGQLAAAYLILARNVLIFYQLPLMAAASLVSGGLVGLLSVSLVRATAVGTPAARAEAPAPAVRSHSAWHAALCAMLLAWSAGVMFAQSWLVLAASALAAAAAAQLTVRGSWAAFLAPVRSFWLLLLAIAGFHAFFSYGTRIEGLPLVTREGLREAGAQLLRLWTWLQLAGVLKWARFDAVFMRALGRLFPGQRETLSAGLLALEYFPEAVAWARRSAGPSARQLLRSPGTAARTFAADLYAGLLRDVLLEQPSGAAGRSPGV